MISERRHVDGTMKVIIYKNKSRIVKEISEPLYTTDAIGVVKKLDSSLDITDVQCIGGVIHMYTKN